MKPKHSYNFHVGDTLPRKRKGSKLPLSEEEYKRMRRQIRGSGPGWITARNLLLVNAHTNTSLRASDVLKLNTGHVYRKGKFLLKFWLDQQKTGQPAMIDILPPIQKDLFQIFHEYTTALSETYFDQPQNPLFPSRKRDTDQRFKAISYSQYLMMLKSWLEAIGLNPDLYGTHSLRASVPLEYYKKTKDRKGTSKLFSHSSTKTTDIYIDQVAKDLATEYRKSFYFEG